MPASGPPHPNPESTADFMRLYAEWSRHIYWVIRTAVIRPEDADNVFQETSLALWQNFGEFQPGTNFAAWASQVARNHVRRHFQRQARDHKLFLGDETVEKLLVVMELYEVHLGGPIDAAQFAFQPPPEIKPADRTAEYLDKLGLEELVPPGANRKGQPRR